MSLLRRAGSIVCALLLSAALGTADCRAQWVGRGSSGGGGVFSGIEAGPRGGRDFENHAWSLGAQVRVPLGRSLELRPSGDFFFPKEGKNGRQLNADAALRLGKSGSFYAGGGIAWVDLAESDGKQRGHNLFFGLSDHQAPKITSFVELRWTFYNHTSPFRLAIGFNYALAH